MDSVSLVVTCIPDQERPVCLDWKREGGSPLQKSSEWLHQQIVLSPFPGALCCGFTSRALTPYRGNLAHIGSDVPDRSLGCRHNVYTTALQLEEVTKHLNKGIRGWRRYFRIGNI